MKLSDQQIIDSLKTKIKEAYDEYLKKVKGYKLALEALGEPIDENTIPSSINKKLKRTRRGGTGAPTLSYIITEILTEVDKPLTAREIMNIINSKYNKNYDFDKNFSGAFSQAYKKANTIKIELPGAGRANKNVYALSEWTLSDSELKPEYREKIEVKSELQEEVLI